jgi:hypothetical protein
MEYAENPKKSKHKKRLMKPIITILLTSVLLCVNAQNLTFEKLNSEKIKFAILFRLEKFDGIKRLTYEIDPRDAALRERNTARSKIIHPETKKLTLASTSTCFNILFDFYNPLRYRYKIMSTESTDPSSIAFEKFYSSVLDVAKKINPSIDGITSNQEPVSSTISQLYETRDYMDNGLAQSAPAGAGISPTFKTEITKIKSNELIDWVLWYFNTKRANNASATDTLFKKFAKVEAYLYNNIEESLAKELTDIKSPKIFYESFLMSMLEDLSKKNTAESFQKEMEKIYANLKKLKRLNDDASEICGQIEKLAFVSGKTEEEDYFIRYTDIKRSIYLQKANGIITYRTGLINKFEELLNDINDKFIPSIATLSTTKAFVQPTELGKINEINVQVIESDFEIINGKLTRKEDKTYNFDLLVSEYSSMIAEFGVGSIFFANVNADNFTSDNGIVSRNTDKFFYSPLISLNLVPNIGKGQAFWLMQLGVGSNIDRPCIAMGTGVRIYNVRKDVFKNFSITGGIVGCFVKQLRKYNVGDPATQDEIDKDGFYAPVFRPYIGIQINL